MEITPSQVLMALKAFYRAQPLPLDATEVYDTMDAAEEYLLAGNAYEGQTIKVKNSDGKYDAYTLYRNESGTMAFEKIAGASVDETVVQNIVNNMLTIEEF